MSPKTRHVWVRPVLSVTEYPGLVQEWRQVGDTWEARVTWVEDEPHRIVTDWVTADRLTPVKSKPFMGTAYG